MMKYRLLPILIILSLALSACAGINAASAQTKKPLRVQFTQWWGDYTLIVAQEKGFFDKHGVEVEPVYYEIFADSVPALSSGLLDAGLFAIGDVLNASPYEDLRVVAVYDNGGTNDIIATQNIGQISDLKGKSIGVSMGTPYELYVIEMLRSVGLELSDVNLVNIPPETILASMPQTIQAGYVWEPYTSEALSKGYKVISSSKEVSGLFPDVIVFRESILKERPEDVRAFLKAWFEAVEFRQRNPAESNAIIAEYLNLPEAAISGNAQILNLEENLSMFTDQPIAGLKPIRQTAQINAEFLLRIGTLGRLPNFDTLLTDEFLK